MKKNMKYPLMVLAIAVIPFLGANEFYVFLGQTLAYTTIAVIGLNLLLGLSGQMSLGQGGFYALGAYGSAILASTYGWPLMLSLLAGMGIATAIGVAVGLVALRTRGLHLAVATLAFGFIVEILAQRWINVTGGTMGLFGVPILDFGSFENGQTYFFWFAAAIFILVQIGSDYIFASRWGRSLLAVKESEAFAKTVGLNVSIWRVGVFALSAMLAGLSGALFAHQTGFISSDAFTITFTIGLLIAVVIGGLGHSYGPLLGTALFMVIGEVTAGFPEIGLLIQGGVLVIVLLVFPEGAMGLLRWALPRRTGASDTESEPETIEFERWNTNTSGADALVVKGLSKHYAGVKALQDADFIVKSGQIHALIGPNGAGKSTLINVLAGLYRPTAGSIALFGKDITDVPAHQRAKLGVARTFQNLNLIGSLTVLENVMLGLQTRQKLVPDFVSWLLGRSYDEDARREAMAALRFVGIERFAQSYPGDLSYGHRKLCELARAFAQRPSLLLLDEPIAGINVAETEAITQTVRQLRDHGVTILLIEHDMDFVMQLSDRVTVLDYGVVIADGTVNEVREDPKVIAAYLGEEEADD